MSPPYLLTLAWDALPNYSAAPQWQLRALFLEATRSVADRDSPVYPKRLNGRSQVLVELPVAGGRGTKVRYRRIVLKNSALHPNNSSSGNNMGMIHFNQIINYKMMCAGFANLSRNIRPTSFSTVSAQLCRCLAFRRRSLHLPSCRPSSSRIGLKIAGSLMARFMPAASPADPASDSTAAPARRWRSARGLRGWRRRIRGPAIRCRSSRRRPC